ncbi:MAG TPA: DUF1203 domain-containing protein [Streptosporangiaceae bacterium]|nr:DUF1203 domain-containing protein [Streptosporangiaceae bacterium]
METITGTWTIEAIPAAELDAVRATMRDGAGNRLSVQVDADGGSPLRCCLRLSRPGERLLLISYMPPGGTGGYAERGPVFVHAEPCGGYGTPHAYPPELDGRRQVVRAYNYEGRIADGILVEGADEAVRIIDDLFTQPDIELVQLRNVGYGCYNFAVRRG